MVEVIPDSSKTHWVNRAPMSVRPYLQLSRLDRPVGYWLLALPGWIGLAFAGLSHGLMWTDLKWAALILIGAIAMRGAGCTYNDIVDQDLDAQVERTALRPLPAGTITNKQAWIWLFLQCGVGLIVLLCLPRLAQILSLLSIPLVAAYPFMKRITWWPQVWLGLTFNWAVLVAYAAKTGTLSPALFILYLGLMFWTVGYDTIYACQDIEDDAFVGIKSTARRFGKYIKAAVALSYTAFFVCTVFASTMAQSPFAFGNSDRYDTFMHDTYYIVFKPQYLTLFFTPLFIALVWQIWTLKVDDTQNSLFRFKFNKWVAVILILIFIWMAIDIQSFTQP